MVIWRLEANGERRGSMSLQGMGNQIYTNLVSEGSHEILCSTFKRLTATKKRSVDEGDDGIGFYDGLNT
jgi:hypothetical protein